MNLEIPFKNSGKRNGIYNIYLKYNKYIISVAMKRRHNCMEIMTIFQYSHSMFRLFIFKKNDKNSFVLKYSKFLITRIQIPIFLLNLQINYQVFLIYRSVKFNIYWDAMNERKKHTDSKHLLGWNATVMFALFRFSNLLTENSIKLSYKFMRLVLLQIKCAAGCSVVDNKTIFTKVKVMRTR